MQQANRHLIKIAYISFADSDQPRCPTSAQQGQRATSSACTVPAVVFSAAHLAIKVAACLVPSLHEHYGIAVNDDKAILSILKHSCTLVAFLLLGVEWTRPVPLASHLDVGLAGCAAVWFSVPRPHIQLP